MENDWISLKDERPEKGVDVEVLHSDGRITSVYRCSCPVKSCTEWRCSLTGFGLMIHVTHWRKIQQEEKI